MKSNKSALDDGKRIRARHAQTYDDAGVPNPRRYKMDPGDVIKIIKKHILATMGDDMENRAVVYGKRGFFYIKLPTRPVTRVRVIKDIFWQGALCSGMPLRRVSVGLALRAMHGEVLTG